MTTQDAEQLAWPLPIERLSASSFGTFARCPEQWRRRYLKGEKMPPSASAVVGNAAHGAAEINYSQKRSTGIDLSKLDLEDAYSESFDHEVERNGGPREIDWKIKRGKNKIELTPGKARDVGWPLAEDYHKTVAPTVQPIGTEEWFTVFVPGVPVKIVGKIDLIDEHGKFDLKFGSRARNKPEISWRSQGLTYLLVEQAENMTVPIGGKPFGWHTGSWGGPRSDPIIWTPATAPELKLEASESNLMIAQRLVEQYARSMVAFYTMFGPDDAWPGALQHSWSCDYCGFRPDCFWWHGPPPNKQISLL